MKFIVLAILNMVIIVGNISADSIFDHLFKDHSIKASLGADGYTASYKNYGLEPVLFQLDMNPLYLAGAGSVGIQIFKSNQLRSYVKAGAGMSIWGIGYVYPGIGINYDINEKSSFFLEFLIGYINVFYYGEVGFRDEVKEVIRFGYEEKL
tara:strand:+ start:11 stop:463 length:453 start_codon:yes stop_codon:yes gene_type:complete